MEVDTVRFLQGLLEVDGISQPTVSFHTFSIGIVLLPFLKASCVITKPALSMKQNRKPEQLQEVTP